MSSILLGITFKADVRPVAYKMVLAKLVDAAWDDGTKIFPAVSTIARAAGISERHTQRVLKAFVGVGLLSVVKEGGHGRRNTTEYSLDVGLLERLGTSHRVTFENGKGTIEIKGDTESPKEFRVTSEAVKDDSGVTQPLIDPLPERDTREREERKSPIAFIPPDLSTAEAALARIVERWPAGAVGDKAKAIGALADLTAEEAKAAADAAPRYLLALKAEKRSYTPSIATYLANRDFERFPEPVKAAVEPSVELKPYTTELYALLWRAVADAVAGKGSPARVRNRLDWLARGMTTPASGLPAHDDVRMLRPVTIGSERFARWMIFCERVGIVRFPVPDAVPVILVPSDEPPPLKLAWKGYHLALPVSVEVRGREWWWRLHCDGAPVEDLIRDRSHGRVSLDLGPVPTRAEADAMIEIDIASDAFAKWEIWFAGKGARLLALSGSVFVPTENPPEMRRAEAPDYEAIEDALEAHV